MSIVKFASTWNINKSWSLHILIFHLTLFLHLSPQKISWFIQITILFIKYVWIYFKFVASVGSHLSNEVQAYQNSLIVNTTSKCEFEDVHIKHEQQLSFSYSNFSVMLPLFPFDVLLPELMLGCRTFIQERAAVIQICAKYNVSDNMELSFIVKDKFLVRQSFGNSGFISCI